MALKHTVHYVIKCVTMSTLVLAQPTPGTLETPKLFPTAKPSKMAENSRGREGGREKEREEKFHFSHDGGCLWDFFSPMTPPPTTQ